MELNEQLSIVHTVATHYWGHDLSQVTNALNAIKVIKQKGGKMVGFFPQFKSFPPVFFKVYFNNAFEYEMRGLQAAQAMPQVPGVRTPTIIKVFPEHKAILTTKRDWDDTTTPIKRFFVGSLDIDWFKVGRWLRAFHDTHVSQVPNEKFLCHKFDKIESHLEKLQALFSTQQIEPMRRIIEQAREYFATKPIEWVISHGDFGLANIKVAGNQMEIIDFEDCQIAPREFDVINLLTRLEYANYFPHIKRSYNTLKVQFFDGYGIPLTPHNQISDFFFLFVKLDMLETYLRRQLLEKQPLIGKVEYKFFLCLGITQLKDWLRRVN